MLDLVAFLRVTVDPVFLNWLMIAIQELSGSDSVFWLLQKVEHRSLTHVNGGSTTVQTYQCGQDHSEK